MQRCLGRWTTLVVLLSAGSLIAEEPSFNRDIRPLLAENCFQCHGPDEDAREAELRLDTRQGATSERDGAAAVVPGDAQASQLIQRIMSSDADLRMPPADAAKQLTADQILLLRKWITGGAPYAKHWSFAPIKRPQLPPVEDQRNPRNAIDHFVFRRLQQERLTFSPAADRYTLIRRLSLDLLGVLPSVAQVDTFVQDARPDAYEHLIDRLLASPRLGERWGRHWLDQARYADSHGYTNDNARIMWPYRDWVITAFNRDLPFDQFTIEQLAGDLLPKATLEQLIATGFHRNTLINSEGGTKADQFRDEQVKDRVDTTGVVWLGLTVGCAKCHAHKYDPISQTEYYQLYAFFNSTADANSITPSIKAPTFRVRSLLAQLDARRKELQAMLSSDDDRTRRQQAWEAGLLAPPASASDGDTPSGGKTKWTVIDIDGKSLLSATLTPLPDKSLLVDGPNQANDEYHLTTSSPLTVVRSVRLEALTHEDLPASGPGRADNGNFVLSEFWFRTGDGRELRFSKAHADHSQRGYGVMGAIDGNDRTGWAVNGSPQGGANHNRTGWFVLPVPLEIEKDHALTFKLQFKNGNRPYNLGRLRLSISSEEWVDSPSMNELAQLAAVAVEKRSKTQQQRLEKAFLAADLKLGSAYRELQRIVKRREQLDRQIPSTMILKELASPRPAYVQVRGDFLRHGAPVTPDVPAALPSLAFAKPKRSRLEFAHWLTHPDNPLTARVRVNRIWMRLFGLGLVETENDFGTQGALPTHPDLLDWLAAEYIQQDWSTKQLLRLIVNSATYRQASHSRNQAADLDPKNRWLWRQNRLRVEGEIVRDLALSAAGLLSNKIGGPSVYPPQPAGVYAFTQRAKKWQTSTGEDRFRRGLYTFFYRSAPYPMLTTFDAPRFNQTCTHRARSNTPLQALAVANDEAMFQTMQALAQRLFTQSEFADAAAPRDDVLRIRHMFRICLSRPPMDKEIAYLKQFLESQKAYFASRPELARTIVPQHQSESISLVAAAAWVATARVILNLDEFITRE